MKLFTKTLSTIVLLLFILSGISYTQEIYFCENVDNDGYPVNESKSFTIPDNGGYLYVLIRLPYAVDCNSVSFEIYRNGDYDNTIDLDTDTNWTWFWKQITFYKSGSYSVKVYDGCYDDLLVSGKVRINFE